MLKLRWAIVATAALVLSGSSARADQIVDLTFDEVAETPANGLTVEGITFGVTGPFPGDAFYNDSLFVATPADARNLSGSVLSGDSQNALTLTFFAGVFDIRFATLLSTTEATPSFFSVELISNALGSLGTINVGTTPLVAGGFSEGVFQRVGGPLVNRAVIRFDAAPGRFAIDNLRIRAVPEPGSLALLGLGGASLAALRRRRRAAIAS